MQATSPEGVAVFDTIFPGFYIQRTIHIHVQVQTDWSLLPNGTVNSSRIIETGQIFASEELSQQIMALDPYVTHTEVARWGNDIDAIYNQAVMSDAQAVMDTQPLFEGQGFEAGVLGYMVLVSHDVSLFFFFWMCADDRFPRRLIAL